MPSSDQFGPLNQFRVLSRNDKAAASDNVGAIVVTNDGAQTISEIKFAVDIVADITGLSIEEVQKIADSLT